MEQVTQITVEFSQPAVRLDAYLCTQLPQVSRGAVQRMLEEGSILVDGKPSKTTHHPKAGEVIDIRWPTARPTQLQPEDIELEVLFEDADLLVINKRADMVVHPAAGHEEHTLVHALLHHCQGQLSGIGGVARPGIVHRLDKDTSGCLVVAKNDFTHIALSEQFAEREVEKDYHAILCGALPSNHGEIRAAIARHPSHRKRMAVTDGGGGRDAWTSYDVEKRLWEATLVRARLHTGRTHQIRVHFQHLKFPLVGDLTYGNRQNARLKELTGVSAPRQMLHASKLEFTHPRTGKKLTLTAPLPEDFCAVLKALKPKPVKKLGGRG